MKQNKNKWILNYIKIQQEIIANNPEICQVRQHNSQKEDRNMPEKTEKKKKEVVGSSLCDILALHRIFEMAAE